MFQLLLFISSCSYGIQRSASDECANNNGGCSDFCTDTLVGPIMTSGGEQRDEEVAEDAKRPPRPRPHAELPGATHRAALEQLDQGQVTSDLCDLAR